MKIIKKNTLNIFLLGALLFCHNAPADNDFWLSHEEKAYLTELRKQVVSEKNSVDVTDNFDLLLRELTKNNETVVDNYFRDTFESSLEQYFRVIKENQKSYINTLQKFNSQIENCQASEANNVGWYKNLLSRYGKDEIMQLKKPIVQILTLLHEKAFYECTRTARLNGIEKEINYKDSILYYIDSLQIIFNGNGKLKSKIRTSIDIVLKTSLANLDYGSSSNHQLKRLKIQDSYAELLSFMETLPDLNKPFNVLKAAALVGH